MLRCLFLLSLLTALHLDFSLVAISIAKEGSDKKTAAQDNFVAMFNGKNLDGWVRRGGKATYKVEGDAIVGTSVANTPNTFLCTQREYGDFVLEVELKIANNLNSGIQIRSHMHDKPTTYTVAGESKPRTIPAGVVYGYQVEIDPTSREFSGGIYDEARRGWLDNLGGEEKKVARFKRDAWNKYRIEAVGKSIKTWVNDIPAANLTDDMDARGFIALQVHSVGSKEQVGKQVRWRNLRIHELGKRK